MLVELSMVEQRYDAVREVLDGASVKDIATRYGVDRRTLHRWLVRYATNCLVLSPTRAPGPIAAPTRWHPRSKRASSNCAGPIPAGVPHDPQQASPRARGPSVARCDLSLPGAPPLDPTQTATSPARRLQALGEVPFDGAVAARHPGRPSRVASENGPGELPRDWSYLLR